MNITELLEQAARKGASDVFIVAGLPFSYKINGKIIHANSEKLMPADTEAFVRGIYELAGQRHIQPFLDTGDDDFSFAIKGFPVFVSAPISSAAPWPPSSGSSPFLCRTRKFSASLRPLCSFQITRKALFSSRALRAAESPQPWPV